MLGNVSKVVGFSELFELRNENQGDIEMTYIEQFWRNATAADVARALAGEVVEARFRDSEIHVWTSVRRLIGARAVDVPEIALRWLDRASVWRYCQAYAPPQWFLDKPEPGEGYRLLGKFPDEPRQPKDDVFVDGTWRTTECCGPQPETLWYRRRIEQPKPEPKYAVGQRVKIIGGISGPYIGELAIIEAMAIEPTGWFYELRYVEGSFHEPNLEPVTPKHYVLQVGDTAEFPDGAIVQALEKGVWLK